MTRIAVLFALLPLPALAHPGHWGTVAGHDHWIALGALGVAGVIALVGVGRRQRDDRDAAERADAEQKKTDA